ncbi:MULTISPECIES: DUF1330 domain-containing protein [Natrialbaceae]|uniref:DUF1330 domain-containing protein n=1 Tax=Natrialbaceae TaxID=1644061 RepID=UPI00207C7203|nr:DUF1330 domain-containing protein [Natronococcus sp. CG52]
MPSNSEIHRLTAIQQCPIFQEEITDWEKYLNEYLPPTTETIEDHGGEVIIGIPDPDVVEGEWDHSMTAVIEFPSVEDSRAWYDDPTYEELKPIRHEASEYANAIICPGFSPDDLPD